MVENPHGNALRKDRVSIPGQVYLLTAVTAGRIRLLADFESGCLASRVLTESRSWPDSRWLAWVLMPDHLHLLVELGEKDSLSIVAARLKARISRALRRDRRGVNVWQAGFHDHALREGEGVRAAARYLVANPIRAGLAAEVGHYPFWDAIWLARNCAPLDP